MILGFVALLALGCTGSGGAVGNNGGNGGSGGNQVNIGIPGTAFAPQLATAHAGDTVVWTSTDANMPHTVTSDTSEPGLDSSAQYPGGLSNGDTFSWTVPANAQIGAIFYYHCEFHGSAGNGNGLGGGMAGQITVN